MYVRRVFSIIIRVRVVFRIDSRGVYRLLDLTSRIFKFSKLLKQISNVLLATANRRFYYY